jgi:hypothetical protein
MKTPLPMMRQGDVGLQQINTLPAGLKEVPLDKGRVILAYGEVTGHAHAIDPAWESAGAAVQESYDAARVPALDAARATEIAEATIARAKTKARLLEAPDGTRFLEVVEPVALRHEEHAPIDLAPGVYQVIQQREYSPEEIRRVAD